MSDENKVKRPHKRAHGDVERGFKDCYAADEADPIFAVLERRARIAERALRLMQVNNRVIGTIDNYISAAEREIDAEIAQEGRKG